MARKHKTNYSISPWLTAKADCREPKYIQCGVTLFEHPAFKRLTPAQRCLYLAMCLDAGGHREFTFSKARIEHYGFSYATGRDAINALIAGGFIIKLFSGQTTREKNGYAFSERWKLNRALPEG